MSEKSINKKTEILTSEHPDDKVSTYFEREQINSEDTARNRRKKQSVTNHQVGTKKRIHRGLKEGP